MSASATLAECEQRPAGMQRGATLSPVNLRLTCNGAGQLSVYLEFRGCSCHTSAARAENIPDMRSQSSLQTCNATMAHQSAALPAF